MADARKKAADWRALIRRGVDPLDTEKAARQAEAAKAAHTFGTVAEAYIAAKKNRRARTDANEIRRRLIPAWDDVPIHQITSHDAKRLFAKLAEHSSFDAKNAWTHCMGIFKSAVDDDLIAASPLASLDKARVFKDAKTEHRQRALDENMRRKAHVARSRVPRRRSLPLRVSATARSGANRVGI